MALKIIHTADWHIGQIFYGYDRSYEHQRFLDWLIKTIQEQQVDILLVSGDIFDNANPAATSVSLFYKFLINALKAQPTLQIVITAGNHDSPSRLEAPIPLLEQMNVHIVGMIPRLPTGGFDFDKITIPLKGHNGEIAAWCIAMPFLRSGEYPVLPNATQPYSEGVSALYQEAYQFVASKRQAGQAIIAMGHLHARGASTSSEDKSERLLMGGLEFIPDTAFDEGISYTALGHIHKAQVVGERENVRYSGSPLPMSFSELNYTHQAIIFELNDDDKAESINRVEIPVSIPLLRVPTTPKPLTEVLNELAQLEEKHDLSLPPYLEVRVLLEGPEPSLRHKIEEAIANKHVRLAKIESSYPKKENEEEKIVSLDNLSSLEPRELLQTIYSEKYNTAVPKDLIQLFNRVLVEIDHEE